MQEDLVAFGKSAQDLGCSLVAMPDLDLTPHRSTDLSEEDVPSLSDAEDGACGDLQDLVARLNHDPRFDSITISKRSGRIEEIRDDVHSLLFDSQRGNLCETSRARPSEYSLLAGHQSRLPVSTQDAFSC